MAAWSLSLRLTNSIASISGRDGAVACGGSYVVAAGDVDLAAGLDEGRATAISLCHVDALIRDRGWALAPCLRHIALRLKGISPSSRHP